MKRRQFISLLGTAALAWPIAARAQQQRAKPVIGLLNSISEAASHNRMHAMHQGLAETGYVDGKNVLIEYRWADGRNDRLKALAADLIDRQVSVIGAVSDTAALAAKAMTSTVPIVFTSGNDPVRRGLVISLNRPEGNLTGITNLNIELGPKRLELLHQAVPRVTKIALLVNPTAINASSTLRDLPVAAHKLGIEMRVLNASTAGEIDVAFGMLRESRAGALVISGDNFFNGQSEQLAALALRYAIPAIFQTSEFTAAGGLMSYGGIVSDLYRRFGIYIGRILNGERPSDLPVEQATKVELIINLRTAKTLGLTFPLTLLGRADEVIE